MNKKLVVFGFFILCDVQMIASDRTVFSDVVLRQENDDCITLILKQKNMTSVVQFFKAPGKDGSYRYLSWAEKNIEGGYAIEDHKKPQEAYEQLLALYNQQQKGKHKQQHISAAALTISWHDHLDKLARRDDYKKEQQSQKNSG